MENTTLDTSLIISAIYDVGNDLKGSTPKPLESVSVENLDEVRLFLREELAKALKPILQKIASIKFPEASKSIEISNFPKAEKFPESLSVSNLSELKDSISRLYDAIAGLQINVPEPQVTINQPEVIVPPANVSVSPTEVRIDVDGILSALEPLKFISDRPNKPISVRMSDGQKFVKAIQELKKSTDSLGVVYAGSSGISQDEMRTVMRESSGLEIPRYDYMSRVLSAPTQETYVYKSGGASGTTVATVVMNYTDATLSTILNVSKT